MDEVVISWVFKYYPYMTVFYHGQGLRWLALDWFRRLWRQSYYDKDINGTCAEYETAYLNAVDKKQYVACHRALFDLVYNITDDERFGVIPRENTSRARSLWLEREHGQILLDWFFHWLEMQELEPVERFLRRCSRLALYPDEEGRLTTLYFDSDLWRQIYEESWIGFREKLRGEKGISGVFVDLKALLPEVSRYSPTQWEIDLQKANEYRGIRPPWPAQQWKAYMRQRSKGTSMNSEIRPPQSADYILDSQESVTGSPLMTPRQSPGLTQYDLVPEEKRYLCVLPKLGPEDMANTWNVLKPWWLYKAGLVDEHGRKRVGGDAFSFSFTQITKEAFREREVYVCRALALIDERKKIKRKDFPSTPASLHKPIKQEQEADINIVGQPTAETGNSQKEANEKEEPLAKYSKQNHAAVSEVVEPSKAKPSRKEASQQLALKENTSETIFSLLIGSNAEKNQREKQIKRWVGSRCLNIYEPGMLRKKGKNSSQQWACFFWALVYNGYLNKPKSYSNALKMLDNTFPSPAGTTSRTRMGDFAPASSSTLNPWDAEVKTMANRLKNFR